MIAGDQGGEDGYGRAGYGLHEDGEGMQLHELLTLQLKFQKQRMEAEVI